MKIKLEATQDWSEPRLVTLSLGGTTIATLKPVTKSRAGHGDDSSFFESEDRRVVEETVADFLRRALS